MSETQINLKEKTAILAGPLSRMFQSLGPRLAECGADVAFISDDVSVSSKFASNIIENREINSNFGRAMAVESKLSSAQDINEAISKVAESFGGVDIIIDGHQLHTENLFQSGDVKKQIQQSLTLAEGGLPFLLGRKKGRFLYAFHDAFFEKNINNSMEQMNKDIIQSIKELSAKTIGTQVTVNGLAMGPTEEYLLQAFCNIPTVKEAFAEFKKKESQAKIVEPSDVANIVAFFASPLSLAINGQTIRVNYGLN